VAAQLAASQEGLNSMELLALWFSSVVLLGLQQCICVLVSGTNENQY
jgi:hypothetical protein